MFNIDREYIQSLIPDNIRNTWTFERVADIIYATISEDTESGKKTSSMYNDIEYFNTDFTKLSTEMKLAKLSDNGFSFLADIYDDEEALNNLGNLLTLIKMLKGTEDGFKLILQALGLNCEYQSWTENKELEIFTILLSFKTSSEIVELIRGLNDRTIDGVNYFNWVNGENYYTVNPTQPDYQINSEIVKFFGTDYPTYSTVDGTMRNFSDSGYIYSIYEPDFNTTEVKFETSEDITTTQEILRGITYTGEVETVLELKNGKILSYDVNPNSTYYIQVAKERNYNPEQFAIMGTPTIDSDGVVSDFSLSNYMQTPAMDFENVNSFEIITPIATVNSVEGEQYMLDADGLRFYLWNDRPSIYIKTPTMDNGYIFGKDSALSIGDTIQFKLTKLGSVYKAFISVNETPWEEIERVDGASEILGELPILSFNIGRHSIDEESWKSSIDLKPFSVILGEEVLLRGSTLNHIIGIRSEYDLDYTRILEAKTVFNQKVFNEIGTPNISEDGLMEDSDNENYVETSNPIEFQDRDFVVDFAFSTKNEEKIHETRTEIITKYWKYVDEVVAFKQQVPTSNTLGGNVIACSLNSKVYNPNNTSHYDSMSAQQIYYVPKGIKVKSVYLKFDGSAFSPTGYVQSSHDGTHWVNQKNWGGKGATFTLDINDTEFYKYHKVVATGKSVDTHIHNWLYYIGYNADTLQTKTVESTSSDYDYTTQEEHSYIVDLDPSTYLIKNKEGQENDLSILLANNDISFSVGGQPLTNLVGALQHHTDYKGYLEKSGKTYYVHVEDLTLGINYDREIRSELYPTSNSIYEIGKGIKGNSDKIFNLKELKIAINNMDVLSGKYIVTEEEIHTIDWFRTFKGIAYLGNSSVTNPQGTLYFAKDVNAEIDPSKVLVNVGDTVYILNGDDSLVPSGVVLSNNDNTKLTVSLSKSPDEVNAALIKKIQGIARNYLAPLVNIRFEAVQDLNLTNNYFSAGILGARRYKTLEIKQEI